MAIFINEILPNPEGKDTEGEFIELYNNGEQMSLKGWRLEDKSGKKFDLSGQIIKEKDFLVLFYNQTKITINNKDEIIYLYKNGQEVDRIEMLGGAEDGQSLSRQGQAIPNSRQEWQFTKQITPGKVNILPEVAMLEKNYRGEDYGRESLGEVIGIGLLLGVLMGMLAVYVYKLTYD